MTADTERGGQRVGRNCSSGMRQSTASAARSLLKKVAR
jgi:hypothetical protein